MPLVLSLHVGGAEGAASCAVLSHWVCATVLGNHVSVRAVCVLHTQSMAVAETQCAQAVSSCDLRRLSTAEDVGCRELCIAVAVCAVAAGCRELCIAVAVCAVAAGSYRAVRLPGYTQPCSGYRGGHCMSGFSWALVADECGVYNVGSPG